MELEHSTSGPYFADLTTDSLELIARTVIDAMRSAASPLTGWYEAQSPKVQARFLSRLKTLAQLRMKRLEAPAFSMAPRGLSSIGRDSIQGSERAAQTPWLSCWRINFHIGFLRDRTQRQIRTADGVFDRPS